MSKENTWRGFAQLLSSPSVPRKGYGKRKITRKFREKPVNKQIAQSKQNCTLNDVKIDDASDDETRVSATASCSVSEQLHCSQPPSIVPSINPAEVTVDRRNPSGSEIESLSEDEAGRQDESSSDASGSDDCTAIHCKKTKMARLSFVDKRDLKRRRITDDMEFTFCAKGAARSYSGPKDMFNHKSFRTVDLNRTGMHNFSTDLVKVNMSTTRTTSTAKSRWEDLDKSFCEQDLECIEDLPSSSEDDSVQPNKAKCNQDDLLNIEELPSSVEDTGTDKDKTLPGTTASHPTFYINSPTSKSKRIKYPQESPLKTLANVLTEKNSKWNFWQHEIRSGVMHPVMVVKVESIERTFGRVMLRFFTNQQNDDELLRIENIIYLDSSDRQLKTIRAGMDIAFEADERIPPHKISLRRHVYLGVGKICPIEPYSK